MADWRPYTEDNYRFKYLHSKGFRYFCNVDASKPAWIQKGSDHLRMARRNLDGYRLYEDMIQTDPSKNGCPISLTLLRSLMPHGPLP